MRIAIVGAGIAGLTSALSLSGRGHEIVLLEKRTGFGETGAGIQLSPNATVVLQGLGLGPALARTAAEPDGVVIRSLRSGRELARVALGAHMRERYGVPYLSIARADLHTLLLDAVRARTDIRLRVGRSLCGVQQQDGLVRLEMETGNGSRETVESEFAIGADGLWSRMRRDLGDARRPVPSGYVAFRATVSAETVPVGSITSRTGLWLGAGRHVVHYPIERGRSVNIVAVIRRRDAVDGWSGAVEAPDVLDAIGKVPAELRALLAAARAWSAWSLSDLPARRMGAGRVALVGDAAHPLLPFLAQGGALGIEDSATLAGLVAAKGSDVAAAVEAYGRARMARVVRVQSEARRNGRIYHLGGPAALARNFVMGRQGETGMSDRYAWLYGWRMQDHAIAA